MSVLQRWRDELGRGERAHQRICSGAPDNHSATMVLLTCHRSFIQQQLESRGYVRHAARVEQRAIGGAGRGCAADSPLR
jgi:hypothetical protein